MENINKYPAPEGQRRVDHNDVERSVLKMLSKKLGMEVKKYTQLPDGERPAPQAVGLGGRPLTFAPLKNTGFNTVNYGRRGNGEGRGKKESA